MCVCECKSKDKSLIPVGHASAGSWTADWEERKRENLGLPAFSTKSACSRMKVNFSPFSCLLSIFATRPRSYTSSCALQQPLPRDWQAVFSPLGSERECVSCARITSFADAAGPFRISSDAVEILPRKHFITMAECGSWRTETQIGDWFVFRSPFRSLRFLLMRDCGSEASRMLCANCQCSGLQNRRGRVCIHFSLFLVTHRNVDPVVSGGVSPACAVLARGVAWCCAVQAGPCTRPLQACYS